MLTNTTSPLVPRTVFNGPVLEFDFPAFQIGVAEYEEGPTGCTVFYFPEGAATAVDIRGGYPGTVHNYEWNHALCLAGGSLYGLEAAYGVMTEIFARKEYSVEDFALVSGAIIYDYGVRANRIHPDKALGQAALRAARSNVFPLGPRGAGRAATCGWFYTEPAGQGAAFRQIGPTKLAVFVVLNSSGAIVDRQGNIVKGNLNPETGQRVHFHEELERRLTHSPLPQPPHGNTTLTLVITNQKLPSAALTQFGRQVHASLGRCIQPFQTMEDGDVLYAVTTNEIENPALSDVSYLGALASELAWEAVLSVV